MAHHVFNTCNQVADEIFDSFAADLWLLSRKCLTVVGFFIYLFIYFYEITAEVAVEGILRYKLNVIPTAVLFVFSS